MTQEPSNAMKNLKLMFESDDDSLSVRSFRVEEASNALFTVAVTARSLDPDLERCADGFVLREKFHEAGTAARPTCVRVRNCKEIGRTGRASVPASWSLASHPDPSGIRSRAGKLRRPRRGAVSSREAGSSAHMDGKEQLSVLESHFRPR